MKAEYDVKTAERALALSLLAYFPEISHGRFDNVEEFLDSYLDTPEDVRPYTMFNGFYSDKLSGIVRLIRRYSRDPFFGALRIVYDSSAVDRYNCFCAVYDECTGGHPARTVFVVLGGNYRIGDYRTPYGITSSWKDNLIGAFDADTPELRGYLDFYDAALNAALSDLPNADTSVSVIVTGHSKGGCGAKYVTLLRPSADVCYSFDGQGFSDRFIKKYSGPVARRGDRIISVHPQNSIVGAALNGIKGERRIYVRDGKGLRHALHAHIPSSLADGCGRLVPAVSRSSLLSRVVGRVSVRTVRTAERLPFVNVRQGLLHMGSAVQYLFRDNAPRGFRELLSPDSVLLLLIAFIRLPFDLACSAFRYFRCENH